MTRGRLNSSHGIDASHRGRHGPLATAGRPIDSEGSGTSRPKFAHAGLAKSKGALKAIKGGAARIAGAFRENGSANGPTDQVRFLVGGVMPPFCFRDPAGRLAGFDIELAEALCETIGASCRFLHRPFEAALQSLLDGEGEAAIGAIAVTPEREKIVTFSDTYCQDYMRFIGRKDFERPVSEASLRGLRIGVPAGSVNEHYAQQHFAAYATIVRLPGAFDVVPQAMIEGSVDLGFSCFITLHQFVTSPLGRGFRLLDEPFFQRVSAAIAVRKEDSDLLDRLNGGLRRLRLENRLEAIRARWIPFTI